MRRAVVGAAASLLALSCATLPPPLSAPEVVVLTGIVTDSATSQSLGGGAVVTLPGSPVRVATARDGRYHLAACLSRGSEVILSVSRIGYGTRWFPVRVDSDTVRVNPGLEVDHLYEPVLDFADEDLEDVVFSGTVTDATSSPLPGAVVALGADSAVVGLDGRYKFVARKAIGSQMNVQARRPGYYTTVQPVRVSAIRTVRADFRLSTVAPLEGC